MSEREPPRLAERLVAAFAARADVAVVCGVTLLAAALRFWHLGTVPLGLHGDEAWTGLDARRVLSEGWIGPYVASALGQPTGPLYITALLFKLLPQTTATLRLSMALLGVATIPLAWLAFSAMYSRTVGAFAALLLAVMMWHVQLSRTGFMVTAWPCAEMASLWTLWLALRRRSVPLFALAGALLGLGVYTYNAYVLFLPVPFVAVAWALPAARERVARARLLLGASTLALLALIVATPMLLYAVRHTDTFRYHQERVSVTSSAAWQAASLPGRAHILGARAGEWARGVVFGGRPDLGDGLATAGHPLVDGATLLLAVVGLAMALRAWRRPETGVVIAVVLLLPLGAVLTTQDGLFRRTFGLVPFVALLAALPLAWLWESLWALRARQRALYVSALIAALAFNGAWTTYQYFGPVQRTEAMRYVYPFQLDAAARFIAALPPGTYVYFYSDRWSFDYETRRFLAPRATGEDRSREFGSYGTGAAPGRAAFVFLGDYLGLAPAIAARYPGGAATERRRGADVLFRAYVVQVP